MHNDLLCLTRIFDEMKGELDRNDAHRTRFQGHGDRISKPIRVYIFNESYIREQTVIRLRRCVRFNAAIIAALASSSWGELLAGCLWYFGYKSELIAPHNVFNVPISFEKTNSAAKRKTSVYLLTSLLLLLMLQITAMPLALADVAVNSSEEEFSRQYTALTKRIILSGVELERFSLKYRLASTKQPRFRRLRFMLAQEAGAATSLAFEVTAVKQFNTGRSHPLKLDPSALHAALCAAMVGSIVAGSGATLELGSNALLACKNKELGFDPKSANRTEIAKLRELDQLLDERDKLIAAHPDSPAYERAVAEGKMMRQIRNASLAEYATFHADVKGYATFTNVFFLLNALTNSLAATGLGVAYEAVKTPKYNGPSNIIFIVLGGVVMGVPFVSSAAGAYMRKHSYSSFSKQVGEEPRFDMKEFNSTREHFATLAAAEERGNSNLIPALPAVKRMAYYADSQERYKAQIINETTVSRHLEHVALESTLLAPLIGGTLLTQGIFGTAGYYKYTFRPRPQLNYAFRGAVVGTPGAALSVGGTAAWFLAGYVYEHRLRSEHKMPSQIIEERLKHLDDTQALAATL